MSTQDNKKAKRRKNKVATGKCAATIPQANEVTEVLTEENGDAERIARLMDATDDVDIMPAFNKGPNPFMDREKCLLCGRDKAESFPTDAESSVTEDSTKAEVDGHGFEQIQVWVCQSCRNSTDGLHRGLDYKTVSELPIPALSLNPGQEISLDSPLGMLSELNVFSSTGEPTLANGSVCNCGSCLERRTITQQYEQETKALQTVWTSLRTTVRQLYSMEAAGLSEEEIVTFRSQVDKLCSRDPHQLFQRLESQVREFVIEKKMNLRKKINAGYSTPPQAREIMSMLLEEYNNLSGVARIVAENLSTLKDHLRQFKVTWELHNKHLYHNIVYTEPAVQGCLETLCEQLRQGALDKESYTEDTYPNLMKNFVSFRNEMSVILVLWHDCQQLIDRYNEEQAALKVKQKWLKEDWEFFKAQRKILEQQVLKNNPKASMPHRCPCDECTITHMITCGIINPEQLETNGTHHTFNFPPDSSRYIIDVSPPSMSSTTSSSASSSPVPITREMATNHLNSCNQLSEGDNQEMEEKTSQDDEGDDKDDDVDNDDDDGEDDNEEDEDEEGEDDDEEEGDADEEDEDDEDDDGISEDQKEFDAMLASGKLGMPTAPVVVPSAEGLKLWGAMCQQQNQQPEETLELSSQDYPAMSTPCACHHCVSPAQTEPRVEVGPEECQCHICLQQRGQTVSTALPTSLPLPARPAGLHLYPHIHGTLPAAAHSHLHIAHNHSTHPMVNHSSHNQDRSLLQPQLYNLHTARLPFKLDIEDTDSIHDHLLNAYGDWDNSSYDSSRILGPSPHRFSTTLNQDLLPPPPMTADNPFSLEALSPSMASASHAVAASHIMLGSSSMATTTSSAFKAVATAGFATGIPPAFQIPTEPFVQETMPSPTSTAQAQHTSSVPELNLNLRSAALSSLPINFTPSSVSSLPLPLNPPPITRPVTLGGNVGSSPVLGKEQRTYAQPCKKYTLSPQNSGLGSAGKAGVAPPPPPPSSHNHSNLGLPSGVQATSGKPAPKSRQPPTSGQPTHSCSHSPHMAHNGGGESQPDSHAGVGTCSSASALPTTINNVSVGTSTLCTDPDCQSHHDDNCDSIDDSCSEKSSSTSTSNNQKEGKYCDCCYCEFFGHGNPPVAQTSKNYAEMRERLRRRLKQRNEAKQGGDNPGSQLDIQDSAKDMNLDELVKFINGTDPEGGRGDNQQSSRAAKRARQKQRKAEEKLRQEQEERKQKLAAQRLLEEEKVNSAGGQKKKGKHKEERQSKGSTSVRSEGPSADDIARGCQTKAANRGKQRLKEGQPDDHAEKIGGKTQETPLSSGRLSGTRLEVVNQTSSQNSLGKSVPASPLVNDRDTRKSAEVFQPPPHLMKSLAEQALQQASNKNPPLPATSSPAPLPTLGGQPNSPTAKKAKRRLAPGATQQGQLTAQRKLLSQPPPDLQLLEMQRRNEAKQEVAKQIKEVEEFAFQQTQLRKQLQQQSHLNHFQQTQMMQQKLREDHEKLRQELEKQQQQKMSERKKPPQQRTQPRQQVQPQPQPHVKLLEPNCPSPTSSDLNARQSGKQNCPSPQVNRPATNGRFLGGAANHSKLANGVALVSRAPQTCPAPSSAASASAPASNKQLASGTNGLTNQAQMVLSADNHTRIANLQRKTSPEQEQIEQAKNTRGKAKKKKNKGQDIRGVDEVFMPRPEEELESNDMDEADRELEMFKRFVMETPTPPQERQKLDINLNMKDIFSKKKGGMGCI